MNRFYRITLYAMSLLLAFASGAFVLPVMGAGANSVSSPENQITFSLFPNPAFVNCLARFPNPSRPPQATVQVKRGKLNDTLTLKLKNVKPNLDFDLFTVEHSTQLANGAPDPAFKNFGLAWYQSDVHVTSGGTANVQIKTILLDQIFGFDPDPAVKLAPTNTFHVGFWFNDPNAAAPCGFTGPPTPFNGEHKAGPLAMISRPNAVTGLGPLCTNPNSTPPPACNP